MPGAVEGLREAAFQVDEPGRYPVEATVVDRHGEGGKVAFEMEIIRLPPIVPLLLHLLIGASLAATVWFIRSGVSLWFGM